MSDVPEDFVLPWENIPPVTSQNSTSAGLGHPYHGVGQRQRPRKRRTSSILKAITTQVDIAVSPGPGLGPSSAWSLIRLPDIASVTGLSDFKKA